MSAPVIYYIRHGETSWNAQGRLQGTQDIALNDLGRRQAAHAGAVLADLLKRDGCDTSALPFVASPLGRARATMELVRGALKLPVETYALDDRLREIGYGVWEGSTLAEMQAADPELYARRLTAKPSAITSTKEARKNGVIWRMAEKQLCQASAAIWRAVGRSFVTSMGAPEPRNAGNLELAFPGGKRCV